MTNKLGGTLYIGVTAYLKQRVWQHRSKMIVGFTSKYNLTRLVFYEFFADMKTAIQREKQLKKWNRSWKVRLIEENNPKWDDLFEQVAR